jgi:hypothetical protein
MYGKNVNTHSAPISELGRASDTGFLGGRRLQPVAAAEAASDVFRSNPGANAHVYKTNNDLIDISITIGIFP